MVDDTTICQMAAACYSPETGELPQVVGQVEAKNEYVRVWKKDNVVYVGVRGSDDPVDWYWNIHIDLVRWGGPGRVLHGSRVGYDSVHADVRGILKSQARGCDLVFLAHSRGGPIACQLAYSLVTEWGEFEAPVSVIEFGSPVWCTREAAKAYNKAVPNTKRYEAGLIPGLRDPIPRALLWNPAVKHVGKVERVGFYGRPDRMHRIGNYLSLLSAK